MESCRKLGYKIKGNIIYQWKSSYQVKVILLHSPKVTDRNSVHIHKHGSFKNVFSSSISYKNTKTIQNSLMANVVRSKKQNLIIPRTHLT